MKRLICNKIPEEGILKIEIGEIKINGDIHYVTLLHQYKKIRVFIDTDNEVVENKLNNYLNNIDNIKDVFYVSVFSDSSITINSKLLNELIELELVEYEEEWYDVLIECSEYIELLKVGL
ncbi:MAG: hypothetical protein HUJ97_09010 [Bacteroidales bacterium]|nr:hypothetical protein [Clostridia bacterium]MCF0180362.1 hypothetical protein [Bacteroidales bacterium]